MEGGARGRERHNYNIMGGERGGHIGTQAGTAHSKRQKSSIEERGTCRRDTSG